MAEERRRRVPIPLLIAVATFCAAETVLGVLLQTEGGRVLPYASVCLACLFFALFFERSHAYVLTQVGLICTVCADYFLVPAKERQQLPAMLFFSVTQLAYFLRLYLGDGSKKRRAWHLGVRTAASVGILLLTWAVLGENGDALAFVSTFYYANLLCNVVFACLSFRREWLFAVSLVLFALCDTVIGLSFLEEYIAGAANLPLAWLLSPGFNLAWAFYLPSQTLIALSLLPRRLTAPPKNRET